MNELSKNLRLLRPLWRGLPLLLLCIGAAVTLALQYLRYATPLYESTAKIKLAETNEGPIHTTLLQSTDAFSSNNKIGTEVELLKSQFLVDKALQHLSFGISTYRVGEIRTSEMYKQSPFLVTLRMPSHRWDDKRFKLTVDAQDELTLETPDKETVVGHFGKPMHVNGGEVLVTKNEALLRTKPSLALADKYEFVRHSHDELMKALLDRLDITSVDKDVAVIRVSFRSAVPEKAADLVNALATVYMADYLENKYKAANSSVDFIDKQLKAVGQNLSRSENAVAGYRDQKRIVNTEQETSTELHKISELKLQRANLHLRLATANNLYQYMKMGSKKVLELAPAFEAFNDPLSNDIVKNIKDLQAQKHDLLLRFRPQDEKVVAIDEKLTDLNAYLLESINNTRNTLTIQFRETDAAIRQSEKGFVGLPTREKDLAVLERNFQLNEKLFLLLHEKKTEAEIARASPTSFHRIIARGVAANEPIAPNRVLVLAVSSFLGLIIGLLLVYLFAGIRATPTDSNRIQKESSLPLATTIPYLGTGPQRVAFFRQLVTRLELKGLLNLGTKLVISSFTDQEGQAFFTEHLAAALSTQGKKVRAIRILDATTLNPEVLNSELMLVQNMPLEQDSHSLAVMHGATINLVLVDSRSTPLARLQELEQLAAEYQLPNVQLCLNRVNYQPSVLRWPWKRTARREAAWTFAPDGHAGAPATA